MRKILNAQGRKEDENLPHIHYFDDFCGEEKQTVKENILTYSRWRLKVKRRVGHRGERYAKDMLTSEKVDPGHLRQREILCLQRQVWMWTHKKNVGR